MHGDQASDGLPTNLRSVVPAGQAGAVPPTCHGRRGATARPHDVAARATFADRWPTPPGADELLQRRCCRWLPGAVPLGCARL